MKRILLIWFVISACVFASVPKDYSYKGMLIQLGKVDKDMYRQYIIYVDKDGYLHTEIPTNKIKLDDNIGWSLGSNGYGKPVVVYSKGDGNMVSTCDDIYLVREFPKDK